ncbi:MAG: hypothetical protein COA78_32650 [Blastopirellula sp.]|nr:MAG: hypothetical protein COA78_32650 [Blastopirellula sp.]
MQLFSFRKWRAKRKQNQKPESLKAKLHSRALEKLEDRKMLSADPILLGAIYVEEDAAGGDLFGDSFQITFQGGAADTEMTRAILDGDQIANFGNLFGLSSGDVIFDTAVGGLGADGASPFKIVSKDGIDSVTATVSDGGTELILDFTGFDAGDKLVFSIDVDEVIIYNPADPASALLDPVTSGVEFHGTRLTADFTAPHFEDAQIDTTYVNAYDPLLIISGLDLPSDNENGNSDRTDGAFDSVVQQPKPISISGTVFHDVNLNLTQNVGDLGIPDVELALWVQDGQAFVFTGHTTTTAANGDYEFGTALGLVPGTFQVREVQPVGYFSVGAIPGTVAGSAVGETVSGDPDVLTEIAIPDGGTSGIDYDFAEALPATLSGHVYHDRNNDGVRDTGEEGIAGVDLLIRGADVHGVIHDFNVTTDVNGYYAAINMPPGWYGVEEVAQPAGYLDGLDAAGTIDAVVDGLAINPGDQIIAIFLGGGKNGLDYNFGEIIPAEIHGQVHLTDRDGNCFGEESNATPIEGATVRLFDAQGVLIDTTLTDENGDYSFVGLMPGTYSVEEITPPGLIDGGEHIGKVNGIEVGNIGGNDLIETIVLHSGSIGEEYDFCEHLPASLSGNVYHDRDNDGVREAGEEAIAGVSVTLLNTIGLPVANTTTDANGYYEFTNLEAGTYRIAEIQPIFFIDGLDTAGTVNTVTVGSATNPGDEISNIVLKWGDDGINYDFGELQPISLSGHVFHDLNNDGNFDTGEDGIQGVQVDVINTDTSQTSTVFTNDQGYYEVTGLLPGNYRIVEVQPFLFVDGIDNAGTVNGATRGTATNPGDAIESIALTSGEVGVDYDFGEILLGSISGKVHLSDRDGDCDTEESENSPVVGAKVQLFDGAGNLLEETVTDSNGEYFFGSLLPGTYTVVETTPPDLIDGGDHVGTINGAHVGVLGGNDRLEDIVILSGSHGIDYDFCEHDPASLSGYVYHDRNNNGLRNAGTEEGIEGVEMALVNEAGATVATTLTDENGFYEFTMLEAGKYRVIESQPAGYIDGIDVAGYVGSTQVGAAINPGDEINEVILLWGDDGVEYDFGEYLPGSISGTVMVDLNENCELDPNELPLEGVTVHLLDAQGQELASTQTDADGNYSFTNLVPGQYSVLEDQPANYFHGGQLDLNGLADNSVQDRLSRISITSGLDLDGHNFCEIPASTLSGFVFQDGKTLVTADGQLPPDVFTIRDGQHTPDDTPISGVTLELRDGVTGLPIDGSSDRVLAGYYAAGPIRTVTDANGHYQFAGLQAGFYAVFEIHPENYIDGLDTAGSTAGLAVNPGTNSTSIGTLAVNPNNDAIIMIHLPVGTDSVQNNFSELLVTTTPPPPEDPPVIDPPPPVVTLTPPPAPTLIPPIIIRVFQPLVASYGSRALGFTWHLSVVNAGFPRGLNQVAQTDSPFWLTSNVVSLLPWQGTTLKSATWKLHSQAEGDGDELEIIEKVFGMAGAQPIAGDFNGDGITDFGIFIKGHWYIDINGNLTWDEGDLWAKLGHEGDLPVVGDWDGDGKDDIGIFGPAWAGDPRAIASDPGLPDPNNFQTGSTKNLPPRPEEAALGARVMKLTSAGRVRTDLIDHVFHYGTMGDRPLAGDWNGDGIATIAVFRDGQWNLDEDGNGRWDDQVDSGFMFGQKGDLPVAGDFNGDGIDEIGIFRGGHWILDTNGNHSLDSTDKVFELGAWGDLPIVGDWDGDGFDEVGVYEANANVAPTQRVNR